MITIFVAMALLASQYAPSVMERVVNYRIAHGEIEPFPHDVDGYVAVRECADIGTTLWLRPVGMDGWEKFIIADCASKTDARESDGLSGYQWMVSRGIIVEVGYQTAKRWDTVGRAIPVLASYQTPKARGNPRYRKYLVQ